jgi:hypothetical protein
LPGFLLKAKVFLQGPYSGTEMTAALNAADIIPKNSNDVYDAAAYNYTAETVGAIPNPNVVDWVLVDLRSGSPTGFKVETQPAFLLRNGSIVDVDGSSDLAFSIATAGDYYIVVRHRNHLSVMSANPVSLPNATAYDFTTSQSQAYGTNPMVPLGSGNYGMYAGESSVDEQITSLDFSDWLPKAKSAFTGYCMTDFNLDGQVTSLDFSVWLSNAKSAATCQVPHVAVIKGKVRSPN